MTRGLLNAGIEVMQGIDSDEQCRITYETNNTPARFRAYDIRMLDIEELEEQIHGVSPENLLFAACAPCQPFAQLNRGGQHAPSATLLSHFSRYVEAFQPKFIVLENVPGITRVGGFSTLKRFLRTLDERGYSYCSGTLNARDYGVPQTRRRFVLIAIRGMKPTLPPATHGKGLVPYRTVRETIRHLPPLAAGETHQTVPNHRASALSPLNLERIRNTPHDGGNRTVWPLTLWLQCHSNGHSGHTDVYGRMRWDRPAPTLTCNCHSISNGRYSHPEQDRAISLREAAALQSFDDDYIFYGNSLTHIASQIGNAVPVKFAEALGRHLLTYTTTLTPILSSPAVCL